LYCDWRDLLTAKETILLVLQGGTGTVSGISAKLWDLGVKFKPAENEVRARLSELRKQQMVQEEWRGGQVWSVTEQGEEAIAQVTPQLHDADLELFSR
jgi:CTP-dependent riboflavin kinase